MTNPRAFARSFAGGEVTPEFFGRIDDVKYQTGLKLCRNFFVKPHGPIENRSGFAMVREVKTSAAAARLIPFVYSNEQSFAIEMGAGYFRFHTNGATLLSGLSPYEIANPYVEADLAEIIFVQSNDVITLTHQNYPPAELRRMGALSWVYSVISFAPSIDAPTGLTASAVPATTSPGTPTLQSYVVTAVLDNEESAASSSNTTSTGQPSSGIAIVNITKAASAKIRVSAFDAAPFSVSDTCSMLAASAAWSRSTASRARSRR
jgi:hypothetical protein